MLILKKSETKHTF